MFENNTISFKDFSDQFKESLDNVYTKDCALIVTRENSENIVLMSERQYNEIQKEINNLKYLLKLNEADKQIQSNETFEFDLNVT